MPADIAIRDVRIVDGTGRPAFDGDVTVDSGRITAVGTAEAVSRSTHELDGRGLVLAPGFVDAHTHDDGALLAHPGLEFKAAQGCTTLVVGNCGFSAVPHAPGTPAMALTRRPIGDWQDLDGYRRAVEARRPALNAIALVGHNSARALAVGPERRPATATEVAAMRSWVEQGMEQGACGLSTGLIYRPGRYAGTEEIVALAEPVGSCGGVYATHLRNEGDRLLEAVDEALAIGAAAGCAVHLSHHKAAGKRNWGKVVDSLARVDEAVGEGADVTLDVYPYTAGSGPMIEYFDLERVDTTLAAVTRIARCPAFPAYEGRMVRDIAEEEQVALDDVVRRILRAPRGDQTLCIQFLIDEADVETNLRHPRVMVGSDGIPDLGGRPHPRLFGTFPRVLARYVRERNVLTLEEAVRRMTSLPCDRFGIVDRGRVAEGSWADLVVFDPRSVQDTATYDEPQQAPTGIAWVLVNGRVTVDHGRHTGAGAGRLLRFQEGTIP